MRDLAIAARVGSPSTSKVVVERFINSLFKNIGDCDWCLFISLGNVNIDIISYIENLALTNSARIKIFQRGQFFWSDFINEAINQASDFEWFIKSHDDIELKTPLFFNQIDSDLKNNRKLGWVSFTDNGYIDGYWAPPTRPGYHVDFYENDAWNLKIMFQYNKLEIGWEKNNLLKKSIRFLSGSKNSILVKSELDFPLNPVRCHAPWNMFVMIRMSTLRNIGACESWKTLNALFVDEDWGLRAMNLGLRNIFIPSIEYYHNRPNFIIGGNRSQRQVKVDQLRVKELFRSKWGFEPNPGVEGLKNIPESLQWSISRASYDWDYNIF